MHSSQRKGKLVAALLLVVTLGMISACTREKSRTPESRTLDVFEETKESALALPLLESFGVIANARVRELAVPMPTGKTQNAVSLRCLEVALAASHPAALQKLVPLYAGLSPSRVDFSLTGMDYFISDLLSPAAQAALNNEFQFDSKTDKLSSADALFSVMLSDARGLRFFSYEDSKLDALLFERQNFEPLGGVSLALQNSEAYARQRNSGLAVGDIVLFQDNQKIEHAAVWLDHDLYFEALVFGRSVLFRLSNWSQLTEELALRNYDNLNQFKVSSLRRMGTWAEIASRIRKFGAPVFVAQAGLGLDARGRGRVSSASGVSITSRLREPTDGGVSPRGNR